MLARTRLKLKNAESSIAFLQEQHAKTLEDLHKEIERLQKKSARLMFQLTMTGSKVDSDQAKLEEDLISEVAKLQSDLSKEQEKSSFLKHQVEHLLAKHMEDTTSRDEVIRELNSELDAKVNTIVLLTQQLYRVRTRLKLESEERSQQPTGVCICPHCFVHKKMIRSGSADSRLSPLHESDPTSLEYSEDHSRGTSSADSAASNSWLSSPPQSTPPLSPHPPPASAPRSHIIKRRASTPVRRQTPSPKNPLSSNRDHTHLPSSRQSLRPALAAKDTGRLSSELQQLLSLKDKEVKVSRRRQTHPVLPPISSSSNLTDDVQDDGVSPSSVMLDRSSSGHYICTSVPVPMPTDTPQIHHHHHRRLILAKSKGLSSAPSKLRVLRYSSHGRGEGREEVRGGGGAVPGDEEGDEGEETNSGGTLLLVKETDQEGRGVGPTQWGQAAAEGDACS